jgi:hypothetical protein
MSSPLPRRPSRSLSASIARAAVRALTRTRVLAALALAGASLVLVGCPGDLDPALAGGGTGTGGGGGSSSICDAPTMVFASTDLQKGCGSDTACHSVNTHEAGLDLVSPGVVSRLLDKMVNPATTVSCNGSTTAYLKSGTSPAQGLMIDKLNATPSCGLPMPYPGGGLPAAQKTCLIQWANAVTTGMITQ